MTVKNWQRKLYLFYNMQLAMLIIHILISAGLITLILLQSGKGGLGKAFGGGQAYRTRRGAEKIVYNATLLFAVLFLITSVANMFVR